MLAPPRARPRALALLSLVTPGPGGSSGPGQLSPGRGPRPARLLQRALWRAGRAGPGRRALGSHSCQLQRPGTGRLSVFEGKSRDRAALKQSTLFLRGDWLSAESHCVNGRVKGEHRVTAAVPYTQKRFSSHT